LKLITTAWRSSQIYRKHINTDRNKGKQNGRYIRHGGNIMSIEYEKQNKKYRFCSFMKEITEKLAILDSV
jgi:hypothetical protein